MRYLYSAAVLAMGFVAAYWLSSDSRANDSASELIARVEPVACWKLDADAGRVLLDETERYIGLSQGGVSFARHGAIQSAGDRALLFDGQSGCVVVRHHNEFLLDQGSIACWIRADDVTRAQGILSKDAYGFGEGGHLTVSINQGRIAVRLQSATDSYELGADVRKNRWTHVAFTFGGTGMQLYIDGKLADSSGYLGGLGASSGGDGNHEPLVFGASTMTTQAMSESPLTSFFKGELDEVAIFARQLTLSEIAELVNAAVPQYNSLVRSYVANRPTAWWRLGEPSGDIVAIDQVGQQHGTYNVVGPSLFDGDDFVDLGALDLDSSFTILAHVKPESFAVSDARIIAKENGLDEADQFWSLSTTIRQDRTRIRFRLRTENGTREAVAKDRDIHVNERVFIAATYDGTMMRLYQDGELVSEVVHRGDPMKNSHCHAWIGDSPSGAGNRPFDGTIHDVSILQEAISQDQIRAIFHASHAPMVTSPPSGPTDLADVEPADSPPLPPASVPAPTETPSAQDPNRNAAVSPFVHCCPLCEIHYCEAVVDRVMFPGTISLPLCEAPRIE